MPVPVLSPMRLVPEVEPVAGEPDPRVLRVAIEPLPAAALNRPCFAVDYPRRNRGNAVNSAERGQDPKSALVVAVWLPITQALCRARAS